jgi:hypothetical protein
MLEFKTLDLKPRLPEILSSSEAARAIAFDLAAGETLSNHEVHERAWLLVIDGAIEVRLVQFLTSMPATRKGRV